MNAAPTTAVSSHEGLAKLAYFTTFSRSMFSTPQSSWTRTLLASNVLETFKLNMHISFWLEVKNTYPFVVSVE